MTLLFRVGLWHVSLFYDSIFFYSKEGKIGVVVTFLAILELLKDSLIEIVQSEEFGPIHIKGIDEVH